MSTQEKTFKEQFDKLVVLLEEDSKILITSHMNPDPDAVASMLGMKHYLDNYHQNFKSDVLVTGNKDEQYDWLPDFDKINWKEDIAPFTADYNVIILVDCHSRARVSETPEMIDLNKHRFICIDHHPEITEDFELVFSDSTYAAAAQQISNIFFSKEDLAHKNIAETLLYGILSDTGGLTFVNKEKSNVLVTVKEIIDASGCDLQVVKSKIESVNKKALELVNVLLSNTKYVELSNAPSLSYAYLERENVSSYGQEIVSDASHVYMFSYVRKVKGYPWGFVVTPRDNYYKISFRSSPGAPNVKKICNEFFEGGGHVMAAGGKYMPSENNKNISAEKVAQEIIKSISSAKIEINPF